VRTVARRLPIEAVSDQIEDIARAKESGSIEVRRRHPALPPSAKGEDDLVTVSVAKNRLGRKAPFRLK